MNKYAFVALSKSDFIIRLRQCLGNEMTGHNLLVLYQSETEWKQAGHSQRGKGCEPSNSPHAFSFLASTRCSLGIQESPWLQI